MTTLQMQDVIPAGHPCLPGHFPGHPLVPAVLLLERVQELLQQTGAVRIRCIRQVKFLSPLRPGESFTVRAELAGHSARFHCACGERLLAQGSLEFEPRA